MSKKFLYLYVFLTGAAVMSIEMSASRLIAPYFGTSLMVWANIIGIILLAMSAGYFIGGRLADRYPQAKILFSLSLGAGLLLTGIPLISGLMFKFLTAGILATPVKIIVLAFTGVLLVFAPPIFILAMVSPYALRLSFSSSQESGQVAGRLYAFSTLGSILGTFLPSFVLIPYIGTRNTIYLSAFVLIGISAIGLRRIWAIILALVPLLLVFYSPHNVKADPNMLWEKETPYQYVQVIKLIDGSTALVYNEGGGVQSIARPNHALFGQDYYDYYLMLPFLRPASGSNSKVWILGSAGGTMMGLFDHWVRPALPNLSLTGVEIDPDVIPLGQKYFGLKGNEGEVVNADARIFLNSRTDAADLIIVDAYSNQIYIPFHLSTQEFYQQVQKHLKPGGILALNVNATSDSSPLLQAFETTLSSTFKYTYTLPVPDSYNFVLLATDEPLPQTTNANLPEALKSFASYYQKELKQAPAKNGLLLTDDRAPVEFLTDQMIWEGIKEQTGVLQ